MLVRHRELEVGTGPERAEREPGADADERIGSWAAPESASNVAS